MATKKQWRFKLTQEVTLRGTQEHGTVIGRAHYLESNPSYYVRYVTATGSQQKDWFDEVDLASKVGTVAPREEDFERGSDYGEE